MDNSRIEQIKQNKIKRQKTERIKISLFFICVILIILGFYFAIKGTVNVIKSNIPTPAPTPVAVISKDAAESASENTSEPLNSEESKTETTTISAPLYAQLPDSHSENDLLNYIKENKSDKKVCYLTFDDGPNNSVTIDILDILRKYNIKATFFEVGTLIEENADSARRVYEEGHLIAGHSMEHNYSTLYANSETFMSEVTRCEEQIKNIVGNDYFPLIRFPGGSYNSGTYGEAKQIYKEDLKSNGYYFADWNSLSGDAEGTKKSAEQLVERVKETTKGQNQIVILMHDAANKKETVKSLGNIIDYLLEEGYVFSRLDKLIF